MIIYSRTSHKNSPLGIVYTGEDAKKAQKQMELDDWKDIEKEIKSLEHYSKSSSLSPIVNHIVKGEK